MSIKYPISLSTTEPNNQIGLLKIRQDDEQTQTLVVQVTENGLPKNFEGLDVFFCAKIGQNDGLGIIEQHLEGEMSPKDGTLEYVVRPQDWQILGRQVAYFSFRKLNKDLTFTEQFSTKDFYYQVVPSVFSKGIQEVKPNGSNYIWTFEDLLRTFREFIGNSVLDMDSLKDAWNDFVEANKEILESVDPGGKLLKEIIDAMGDYDSLADRLNQLVTVDEIELPPYNDFETLGGVREVFRGALNSAYSKIDENKFNYVGLFDLHYDRGALYSEEVLRHGITHLYNVLVLSDKLDAIVLGGDNVDCNGIYDSPKNHVKNLHRHLATKLFAYSKAPLNALLIGNHDDGSSQAALRVNYFLESNIRNKYLKSEYFMTDADFVEVYRQNEALYGEKRFENSNYFYHDNEDKKVRVIGLNSSDQPQTIDENGFVDYPRQHFSGFSLLQMRWLINEALNVPADYTIVVMLHWPLESVFELYPGNVYDESHSSAINHNIVLKILEAYQAKSNGSVSNDIHDDRVPMTLSYDFTDYKGEIALVHAGHIHHDKHAEKAGILHVTTCCSQGVSNDYNRGDSTFNTLSEECFDVVELDTQNRTINMRRVGAGIDRQFTY